VDGDACGGDAANFRAERKNRVRRANVDLLQENESKAHDESAEKQQDVQGAVPGFSWHIIIVGDRLL
jgi:hypothetical protein